LLSEVPVTTNRLFALSLSSLLAVIPGCITDGAGDAEDGENDVATGKADSPSSADAALILSLVNDIRLQNHEFDEQVGLSSRVANAIAAHRDGADGEWATGDDDHFDSLEELDAIPYVGPVAMQTMLTYAKEHDVPTKLRIDLKVREDWDGDADLALSSFNTQLQGEGIHFDDQLTLGARDGIKFIRVLKDVEKANEKLGREFDIDFTWNPGEYAGLCYQGELEHVTDAVEGLRYSLFSIYMGMQAERWGTHKEWNYSGAGGDTEREWIDAQRDENDHAAEIEVWTSYDTSSKDYLMMTDGGQQGDGTEFFAVTIPPCN
jgi:hypothetical protein